MDAGWDQREYDYALGNADRELFVLVLGLLLQYGNAPKQVALEDYLRDGFKLELQDCSLALEAFGIHERHPEEILEHFVLLVIEELVYLEPIFRVDHSNEHDDVHHCVHKHQKDVHTKHQQQLSRQNQE